MEPETESEAIVFGSLGPEPLEKKPGAGAAWKKCLGPKPLKNFAGSSALLEDKKHIKISGAGAGFFGPLEPQPLNK